MEQLKQCLDYNPDTGRIWYVGNHHRAGNYADRPDCYKGYMRVTVDSKAYKAHRVIWFLHTGYWPAKHEQIDHINGIKTDNRICNLRLVSHSGNMLNKHKAHKNNALGTLGVRQKGNKYEARFRRNYLGIYDTLEEAVKAYQDAKVNA